MERVFIGHSPSILGFCAEVEIKMPIPISGRDFLYFRTKFSSLIHPSDLTSAIREEDSEELLTAALSWIRVFWNTSKFLGPGVP